MISVNNLSFTIGRKKIIDGITVDFSSGAFHVIVGPNGSGKSSFLKLFSGEWKPDTGSVRYHDLEISRIRKSALAKMRAVMSQHTDLHFPLPVMEVVLMGRYPYFEFTPSAEDHAICLRAMQRMQVEHFARRDYLTLSGGEKQRVQFARVLAQVGEGEGRGSKFLFLDEAVSSLDIRYQHHLLQTARSLSREGVTVIAILHDLNLAFQYADDMLFMKEGKPVYAGCLPDQVTGEMIRKVFDVDASIMQLKQNSRPVVVFGS